MFMALVFYSQQFPLYFTGKAWLQIYFYIKLLLHWLVFIFLVIEQRIQIVVCVSIDKLTFCLDVLFCSDRLHYCIKLKMSSFTSLQVLIEFSGLWLTVKVVQFFHVIYLEVIFQQGRLALITYKMVYFQILHLLLFI